MKTKVTIIALLFLVLTGFKLQAQDKSTCYYYGYAYDPTTKTLYISNIVSHTHGNHYPKDNQYFFGEVKKQWNDYVKTYLDDKQQVYSYSNWDEIVEDKVFDKCYTRTQVEIKMRDLKKEYLDKGYSIKYVTDFSFLTEE